MSTFVPFVRRPAPREAGRESAPAPRAPADDRPAVPPPSLRKIVPEDVDPAELRARDNLDGE